MEWTPGWVMYCPGHEMRGLWEGGTVERTLHTLFGLRRSADAFLFWLRRSDLSGFQCMRYLWEEGAQEKSLDSDAPDRCSLVHMLSLLHRADFRRGPGSFRSDLESTHHRGDRGGRTYHLSLLQRTVWSRSVGRVCGRGLGLFDGPGGGKHA